MLGMLSEVIIYGDVGVNRYWYPRCEIAKEKASTKNDVLFAI